MHGLMLLWADVLQSIAGFPNWGAPRASSTFGCCPTTKWCSPRCCCHSCCCCRSGVCPTKLTGVVGPFQRSGGVPSGGGRQLDALLMSMPSDEPRGGGPNRSTERAGGSSSGRDPSATSLLRIGPPKLPPPATIQHTAPLHRHAT